MDDLEYQISFEGVLESIGGTRVVGSFVERGIKEITTPLVIKVGEVDKKIDFPGIVYPDSIGHKVKYSRWKEKGPLSHPTEELTDLELKNRTYIVLCEHF